MAANSNLAGRSAEAVAEAAAEPSSRTSSTWQDGIERELDGAVELPVSRRRPLIGSVALAVAIAFVAVNLRPVVTSLSSVLDAIQASLGVSAAWSSAATALPPLCFAGAGVLAPWLNRRLGMARSVAVAMVVLAAGAAIRGLGGPVVILFGTFLAAAGIAVGNVLLPVVVKESFPLRLGLITGIYTAMLQGGGSIGASVTPALLAWLGGWRPALMAWAVVAGLAAVLWMVAARHRSDTPPSAAPAEPAESAGSVVSARSAEPSGDTRRRSMLRSAVAWHVTLLFALQSFLAYSVMGWLPQVFIDTGIARQPAGLLLGLCAIVAVPLSMIVPAVAARQRSQSPWVIGLGAFGVAGILGLILAPSAAPALWAILLGVGMSVFSLVLTLISLRTKDAADTARLSAMAQGVGYLIAASGPFLFGLVHSVTGGWTVPWLMLLGTVVVQLVFGALAGRPRHA